MKVNLVREPLNSPIFFKIILSVILNRRPIGGLKPFPFPPPPISFKIPFLKNPQPLCIYIYLYILQFNFYDSDLCALIDTLDPILV
jgi:hypothetical protein